MRVPKDLIALTVIIWAGFLYIAAFSAIGVLVSLWVALPLIALTFPAFIIGLVSAAEKLEEVAERV